MIACYTFLLATSYKCTFFMYMYIIVMLFSGVGNYETTLISMAVNEQCSWAINPTITVLV